MTPFKMENCTIARDKEILDVIKLDRSSSIVLCISLEISIDELSDLIKQKAGMVISGISFSDVDDLTYLVSVLERMSTIYNKLIDDFFSEKKHKKKNLEIYKKYHEMVEALIEGLQKAAEKEKE